MRQFLCRSKVSTSVNVFTTDLREWLFTNGFIVLSVLLTKTFVMSVTCKKKESQSKRKAFKV